MRIINNTSNVSAEFEGLPANFTSNNVQTIINDPVIPECKCNVCIFFDFCSGCYYNPCDFVRFDNSCPFPEPMGITFERGQNCKNRCSHCCHKYLRRRCSNCRKRQTC